MKVGEDGAFDTPLDLSEGKWKIVVTATSAEGKTDVADPQRVRSSTRVSTSS